MCNTQKFFVIALCHLGHHFQQFVDLNTLTKFNHKAAHGHTTATDVRLLSLTSLCVSFVCTVCPLQLVGVRFKMKRKGKCSEYSNSVGAQQSVKTQGTPTQSISIIRLTSFYYLVIYYNYLQTTL